MTTTNEGKPVRRDEPHWYLTIIDDGCALCWAGSGETRVRMRGERPKNPADRFRYEGGNTACPEHFL